MHVKLADIDPELRPAGALLRLIMRPSVRFFKFAAALMRFGKGKDIANLDCEEQFIPSIDDAPAIRTRIYRPKNNQVTHRFQACSFFTAADTRLAFRKCQLQTIKH